MKISYALIATLLMTSGVAAVAAQPAAAKNPLSVHVLNLQTGQPTAGIEV
ncbi:hydroxyisourate hydrolase, partial [Neisseria iguanae]